MPPCESELGLQRSGKGGLGSTSHGIIYCKYDIAMEQNIPPWHQVGSESSVNFPSRLIFVVTRSWWPRVTDRLLYSNIDHFRVSQKVNSAP